MITTDSTATAPILAIDLGKYKSVVCVYRSPDEVRFTSVPTTRNELHRLIEKHRPEVVLIEACLLCGWVRDLSVELGVPCWVANPSSEAWKFKHLNRKIDRDDALRLVEVYRLGKFPRVAIPEKEVREKRGLIEHRQKLVGRRVALFLEQVLNQPCSPGWVVKLQHQVAAMPEAQQALEALDLEAEAAQFALGEPLMTLWTRTTEKARKVAAGHQQGFDPARHPEKAKPTTKRPAELAM